MFPAGTSPVCVCGASLEALSSTYPAQRFMAVITAVLFLLSTAGHGFVSAAMKKFTEKIIGTIDLALGKARPTSPGMSA